MCSFKEWLHINNRENRDTGCGSKQKKIYKKSKLTRLNHNETRSISTKKYHQGAKIL